MMVYCDVFTRLDETPGPVGGGPARPPSHSSAHGRILAQCTHRRERAPPAGNPRLHRHCPQRQSDKSAPFPSPVNRTSHVSAVCSFRRAGHRRPPRRDREPNTRAQNERHLLIGQARWRGAAGRMSREQCARTGLVNSRLVPMSSARTGLSTAARVEAAAANARTSDTQDGTHQLPKSYGTRAARAHLQLCDFHTVV